MRLVYLIGAPGAGKTTIMRAAVGPALIERQVGAVWCTSHDRNVMQLGRQRSRFGGTDALAYDIQPKVLELLKGWGPKSARIVVGEGDRLSNAGFFHAVINLGITLVVVHLDTQPRLALERRAGRGSSQSISWVRGRETHTRRLAEGWAARTLLGDATAATNGDILKAIILGVG